MIQLLKENPSLLVDYLEQCHSNDLAHFMNQMPNFYFDYSEIKDYAEFLEVLLLRKQEKGGFVDYHKSYVSPAHPGLQRSLPLAHLGGRLHLLRARHPRRAHKRHPVAQETRRSGVFSQQKWPLEPGTQLELRQKRRGLAERRERAPERAGEAGQDNIDDHGEDLGRERERRGHEALPRDCRAAHQGVPAAPAAVEAVPQPRGTDGGCEEDFRRRRLRSASCSTATTRTARRPRGRRPDCRRRSRKGSSRASTRTASTSSSSGRTPRTTPSVCCTSGRARSRSTWPRTSPRKWPA